MKDKKAKPRSKQPPRKVNTQQIDLHSPIKKKRKSPKLNQTYEAEADPSLADSTVNIKFKDALSTIVKKKRTPKNNLNKTKPISKKSPKKTNRKKPKPKSNKGAHTTVEVSINIIQTDQHESKPSMKSKKLSQISTPTLIPCPAITSTKVPLAAIKYHLGEEVPDELYLTPQLKPQLPAVPHEQIKAEESFESLQVSIEGRKNPFISDQDQSGYHTPTFGVAQVEEKKIDPISLDTSRKSTYLSKTHLNASRTSALDESFQILMKGKYQFMKKIKSREEVHPIPPIKSDSRDEDHSNVLKVESQDDSGSSPLDKSSPFSIKLMFEYHYPKIHSSKEQEQMELYLEKRNLKDQLLINKKFDHSRKIQPSYNFKSLKFAINSKVILESICVFVIYRDCKPPPKPSRSPRKKKIPTEKAQKNLPRRGRKVNETLQLSIPSQESIEKPERVIRKVARPMSSKELEKLMNSREKEMLNKQKRQNSQKSKLMSRQVSCSLETDFFGKITSGQTKPTKAPHTKTPRKR